jgi:hypothetical protein
VAGEKDGAALTSRQAKACMESDVNQLMFEVANVDTRGALFYQGRQAQSRHIRMVVWRLMTLALSRVRASFTKAINMRGEKRRWSARVSRDSSITPTGRNDAAKRPKKEVAWGCHPECNRLRMAELRKKKLHDGIVSITKRPRESLPFSE